MFNEIQEWFLWDQTWPAVDREENKLSEHNISYGDACFFAPVMKGCEAVYLSAVCEYMTNLSCKTAANKLKVMYIWNK